MSLQPKTRKLTCDMTRACDGEVTMIDVKGYAYCTPHGQDRQRSGVGARKLRPAEVKTLESGGVIRYRR